MSGSGSGGGVRKGKGKAKAKAKVLPKAVPTVTKLVSVYLASSLSFSE